MWDLPFSLTVEHNNVVVSLAAIYFSLHTGVVCKHCCYVARGVSRLCLHSKLYSLRCAATMALRLAMLRSAEEGVKGSSSLGPIRWTHSIAKPSPLDSVLSNVAVSQQFVLPESDRSSDTNTNEVGFGIPCLPFGGGFMELMAVPRKKVISLPFSSPNWRYKRSIFFLHI